MLQKTKRNTSNTYTRISFSEMALVRGPIYRRPNNPNVSNPLLPGTAKPPPPLGDSAIKPVFTNDHLQHRPRQDSSLDKSHTGRYSKSRDQVLPFADGEDKRRPF